MPISEQQLLQILPNAGQVAGVFVPALNISMNRYQIIGTKRVNWPDSWPACAMKAAMRFAPTIWYRLIAVFKTGTKTPATWPAFGKICSNCCAVIGMGFSGQNKTRSRRV